MAAPLRWPPPADPRTPVEVLNDTITDFLARRQQLVELDTSEIAPAQIKLIMGAAYQLDFVIEKLQLARVPLRADAEAAAATRPLAKGD